MNIKRILCIILSVSVILSSFAIGVYGTEAEDAELNRAITVLSALGIMQGKGAEGFGAEDTLTRAEVSAAVLRFIGIDTYGESGGVTYDDVPEGHWAKGSIETATLLGILNGNGDGTFEPDENVTLAQVLKIVVNALGYEPQALDMGGYPEGYMTLAQRLDITDGVDFSGGVDAPVTRGSFARVLYDALEVELMETKVYGDNTEISVSDGVTALEKYHKVLRKKGIVSSVYGSENSGASLEENQCIIDGELYETEVDIIPYLGYYVEFYCTRAEGNEKSRIIAFFPSDVSATRTEIDFDDVASITVSESFDIDLAYYDEEGDKKKLSLDEAIIYYNGKQVSFETAADAQSFLDEHMIQGQLQIAKKDARNANNLLFVENYTSYVVADTSAQLDLIMYDIYTAEGVKQGSLDFSNKNNPDRKVFYYDSEGNEIVLGDIMLGDVISVYESADGDLVKVYASKKTVAGEVTSKKQLPDKNLPAAEEPEKTYSLMSEYGMDGFTVTQGANNTAGWGFGAEKTYNGRTVAIGTDGGSDPWMIGNTTGLYKWSEQGKDGDIPSILTDDTVFSLHRDTRNESGEATSPASRPILKGVLKNTEVRIGETIRVTAWVYPSELAIWQGSHRITPITEGVDQTQDVGYRMWLYKGWKSMEDPGYSAGGPGVESSVGTIPANQWSEISFEYTVTKLNKNVTDIALDNCRAESGSSSSEGDVYPLKWYVAGVRTEKLNDDAEAEPEYTYVNDTSRYELTINAETYQAADGFYAATVPIGQEVTLKLDHKGRVVGYDQPYRRAGFGMIMNAAVIEGVFDDDCLKVKILDSDGTLNTYETLDKVTAYNGTEVTKVPAASLITDQPSNPKTDWHLWSTNNKDNFCNLSRLYLTDEDKSDAASRKMIYYETNSTGKISKIIVPTVPEDDPQCKLVMINNYDVDTWRSRGTMSVAVGSRMLIYRNKQYMDDSYRDEVVFKVNNNAIVYEVFPMNYDESDYSVVERNGAALAKGGKYNGMSWIEAALYRYPGSNTVDIVVMAPRDPESGSYKTVVVESLGETADGYTLRGWANGEPFEAPIKDNVRFMEYVPVAAAAGITTEPKTPEEGELVTSKDMLPQIAEEGRSLWGMLPQSDYMGNGTTPYVTDGCLKKGDIVRAFVRNDEVVFLEVARRADAGVYVTHSATYPTAGTYWSLNMGEGGVHGEVVDVDIQNSKVDIKGYYADIASIYHSEKYAAHNGGVLRELTTWLHIPTGISCTVYDFETGKAWKGTIADFEKGDEVYSYNTSSYPLGLVLIKNYDKR